MGHAIVYDIEFLTAPGAPQRFWCGPVDPDPIPVQIGAWRVSLEGAFEIGDRFERIITPVGRDGQAVDLDPLFTRLTGIDAEAVARNGVPLADALAALDAYSGGARLWSWGKDEFNLIAIGCYVAGLAPPIPIARFGNACNLCLAAGLPLEEIQRTRSPTVPGLVGLPDPGLAAHDAANDAMSVALGLQALLRQGRLAPGDLLS